MLAFIFQQRQDNNNEDDDSVDVNVNVDEKRGLRSPAFVSVKNSPLDRLCPAPLIDGSMKLVTVPQSV